MQAFRRTGSKLVKELITWTAPRYSPGTSGGYLLHPLQRSSWTPLWKSSAAFCQSPQFKDYGVPNPSWSQEMVDQFEKYMALSKDGTWSKIPNRNHFMDIIPESLRGQFKERKLKNSRYLVRCVDAEGLGFEYVAFFNASEKRMVSLFQPGPYLEGPTGLVHGGAVAAILDTTFGGCALFSAGKILTANLNINYKSPIPLGSVVLMDTKVDRTEGRKLYLTGHVQSVDGQTLYAEATSKSSGLSEEGGTFCSIRGQEDYKRMVCKRDPKRAKRTFIQMSRWLSFCSLELYPSASWLSRDGVETCPQPG
ncbi:hypothetical protein JRQ81_009258 [Phrynocephalus forsythii]|uniref:Acyl-coenzyme A thioesterase THEM4 n=1 Tax=Phrynocephalus forsythii TaxID=171643 RepID=A0A9Q0XBI5_9SAUR|nr:hypothetical protein JRQ81_009258 [Phrynocephalus forsythii]